MEIDHATLRSLELPDYTQEASMDESLPLRAAAAEPAPVEYITISESIEHNQTICVTAWVTPMSTTTPHLEELLSGDVLYVTATYSAVQRLIKMGISLPDVQISCLHPKTWSFHNTSDS